MPEATVHIVDDDQGVRKSLNLLMTSAGINVREYESGTDFLEHYEPSTPECLLLDLRMPGMDGLALRRELVQRDIAIPTVFVSGHGDIPLAVRALREGALDFVEKPFDNEHLLARVRQGIRADADKQQARVSQRVAAERLERLTKRERQVVDQLVTGKINKVIGAELAISMRTVESHRARIMKKLEVDSLSDIFKLVLAAEGEGARGAE